MLSYVYASIMMLFLSTYDVAASMEIATCQFQCLCNNVLQNLISATFATTFVCHAVGVYDAVHPFIFLLLSLI